MCKRNMKHYAVYFSNLSDIPSFITLSMLKDTLWKKIMIRVFGQSYILYTDLLVVVYELSYGIVCSIRLKYVLQHSIILVARPENIEMYGSLLKIRKRFHLTLRRYELQYTPCKCKAWMPPLCVRSERMKILPSIILVSIMLRREPFMSTFPREVMKKKSRYSPITNYCTYHWRLL
jgi:hypothetical protein